MGIFNHVSHLEELTGAFFSEYLFSNDNLESKSVWVYKHATLMLPYKEPISKNRLSQNQL